MKKLSMIGLLVSCVILVFGLVSKVSAEAAKSIVIEDFESPEEAGKGWTTGCDPKSKVSFKVDQPGANGTAHCGLVGGYIAGWANMGHELKLDKTISGPYSLTFWACSSRPSKTILGLVLYETDGSRWSIGAKPLYVSNKWEKFTVTSKDIVYDRVCGQKNDRGFEGDWIDFGKLAIISFGIIPRLENEKADPGEWNLKIDEIRMEPIQSIK